MQKESSSTIARNEGNVFFKKYNPNEPVQTNQNYIHQAIVQYNRALKLANKIVDIMYSNLTDEEKDTIKNYDEDDFQKFMNTIGSILCIKLFKDIIEESTNDDDEDSDFDDETKDTLEILKNLFTSKK